MRKVLVVDDDDIVARILAKLLERNGYEVAYALNGDAALATAATFQPDVVLLDLAMPVVTGYEVAKKLKELGANGKPKLVSHTGYARGKGGGDDSIFDEYILKPTDIETLRRVIDG